MKKADEQLRDPILKNLIDQIDTPKVPVGFNIRVMNSIRVNPLQKQKQDPIRIPVWIKIGIPVFMAVCTILIILFPGDKSNPVELFVRNFSDSEILSLFDRINVRFESFQLPSINISTKAFYYSLGGIVLFWMFILSEGISRRFRKA